MFNGKLKREIKEMRQEIKELREALEDTVGLMELHERQLRRRLEQLEVQRDGGTAELTAEEQWNNLMTYTGGEQYGR